MQLATNIPEDNSAPIWSPESLEQYMLTTLDLKTSLIERVVERAEFEAQHEDAMALEGHSDLIEKNLTLDIQVSRAESDLVDHLQVFQYSSFFRQLYEHASAKTLQWVIGSPSFFPHYHEHHQSEDVDKIRPIIEPLNIKFHVAASEFIIPHARGFRFLKTDLTFEDDSEANGDLEEGDDDEHKSEPSGYSSGAYTEEESDEIGGPLVIPTIYINPLIDPQKEVRGRSIASIFTHEAVHSLQGQLSHIQPDMISSPQLSVDAEYELLNRRFMTNIPADLSYEAYKQQAHEREAWRGEAIFEKAFVKAYSQWKNANGLDTPTHCPAPA